jgi:nitroimidazol reductase NimA-like FMN-containing flavoprotein (pyridoxamine 5'-phosphate oxidase superfamily)
MTEDNLRRLTDEIEPDEINAGLTMQVATVRDGQPWNCSVYFVMHAGKFYWLSFPERRHSKELAYNSRAAVAIVIQASQPVVGIQAEGDVEVITDISEARAILDLYTKKYNQGAGFIAHLEAGDNRHNLYCFTPRRTMVFNERDQSTPSPVEVVMTQ